MTKKNEPPDEEAPWQTGTGVKGIRPPGRKLSDETRASPWQASGVQGVTPPGKPPPRFQLRSARKNQRTPQLEGSGPTLEQFFETIEGFLQTHGADVSTLSEIENLILQSRAPFEILVAYHAGLALEAKAPKPFRTRCRIRGQQVSESLKSRLQPGYEPSMRIHSDAVEPLFYDLPPLALAVPGAYCTDAWCQMVDFFRIRDDDEHDQRLTRFTEELREKFFGKRSFGGQPLSALFPWSRPGWFHEISEDDARKT